MSLSPVQSLPLFGLVLLLVRCGQEPGGPLTPPPPSPDSVASVEVAPDSLTLDLGDTGQGTCTPMNQTGEALSVACDWVSSDPSVVQPTSGTRISNLAARKPGVAWIVATAGDLRDSTRVTVRDTLVPPPPPPPSSVACPASEFDRFIQVSTASQLTVALAGARPGDLILLAPGVYAGKFVATAVATADKPICLDGIGKATLTAGTFSGGSYGLHLRRADYWRVVEVEIHTAQKGIMLDRADFNLFDGVHLHDIGQEALHFRMHSSDNVFQNGRIERIGVGGDKHLGEGAYFGSARNNWDTYTGGEPDQADRNQLLNTVIRNATAECVEAKEGTRGTIVRQNDLSECGDRPTNSPAVIGTRGGSGTFECNTITTRSTVDAVAVYSGGPVPGDGDDNILRWNEINIQGTGLPFAIASGQTGNTQIDNTLEGYAANCAD